MFGSSLSNLVIYLGLTSWGLLARVVRSEALTLKHRGFVEAAEASGSSSGKILLVHVLPDVFAAAIVVMALIASRAILVETSLAFLGLGDPSAASWGKTLEEAFVNGAIIRNAWWYFVPAGLGILAVVLAFTLIGRTLEEIANPRLSRGR